MIYWLLMFYRQDCTLFTLMLILCVCIVCLHFHCLLCVWQSFIKELYYYYYYFSHFCCFRCATLNVTSAYTVITLGLIISLLAGLGLSVLMWLLLATKPFLWTSLNHFISTVVHDKVPFVHEVVANRPRLRIGCLPNLLLCMRRNGHNCTSAFNSDCKIKFSIHSFEQNLNFLAVWPRFGPFLPLLVHMRRNGHKTTSGVKFDSIFKPYVPDFLYDEKFGKLDYDFRYF